MVRFSEVVVSAEYACDVGMVGELASVVESDGFEDVLASWIIYFPASKKFCTFALRLNVPSLVFWKEHKDKHFSATKGETAFFLRFSFECFKGLRAPFTLFDQSVAFTS